jgi:uncharacterized protein
MCGYVEARTLWPEEKDFLIVSIGTGELTRSIAYDDAKGWGLAKWAQPILGVVFDGVSDTVDYQLRQVCMIGDDELARYYRFQVILTEGNDDMDDASKTNLRVLKLLAMNLVDEKSAEIATLCKQLSSETV